MHFEVEQKYRVASLDEVRQRLLVLGAKFDEAVDQADTYFSHPARKFAQTDEALRLRRVGESNCITYKGPKLDRETKTRHELELSLPPGAAAFEQWTELLLVLGFSVVAIVRKRREIARLVRQGTTVEAALDLVAGVGQFAELEINTDQDGLASAKSKVASLAIELGLVGDERQSYLEMLLAGNS